MNEYISEICNILINKLDLKDYEIQIGSSYIVVYDKSNYLVDCVPWTTLWNERSLCSPIFGLEYSNDKLMIICYLGFYPKYINCGSINHPDTFSKQWINKTVDLIKSQSTYFSLCQILY